MIAPVGLTSAITAALDFERALLEVEAVLGEVPEGIVAEACRRAAGSRTLTPAEALRRELSERIAR